MIDNFTQIYEREERMFDDSYSSLKEAQEQMLMISKGNIEFKKIVDEF